jgi:hypothetical protein
VLHSPPSEQCLQGHNGGQQLGLLQDPPITEFELILSAAKAKAGKGKSKASVASGDGGDGEDA